MKSIVSKQTLVAGLLSLLFVFFAPVAFAADPGKSRESITVSPAAEHLDNVEPGSTQQRELTVFNDGTYDYNYSTYAQSYSVDTEEYLAKIDQGGDPRGDAGSWITIDTSTRSLKAGELVKVPYTLTVPKNATPGSHTGVLIASIEPPKQEGIVSKKRVGMVMYINVTGAQNAAGQVTNTDIPFLLFKPPLITSARIENTGNTYLTSNVKMTVSSVFGNKLYEDARDYTVLPGHPRKVQPQWKDIGSLGVYKVEMATTLLGKTETKTGYLIVIPLWLIIFTLVGVVALVLLLRIRKLDRTVRFRRDR